MIPFGLYFVLGIATLVLVFYCIASWLEERGDKGRLCLSWAWILFYVYWTFRFLISVLIVEKEFDLKLQEHELFQYVAFEINNEVEIINVNKKYGRMFPKDAEFTVRIYSKGPYANIWLPTHEFTLVEKNCTIPSDDKSKIEEQKCRLPKNAKKNMR